MKVTNIKSKFWITGWLVIVCLGLALIGIWIYKIDPYFHYHKPDTSKYFYELNNQRSQNDGIAKHFDYDALITGTSMTENFKTSEMDEIFGCTSIKIPFAGSSYKEIGNNLRSAVENNSDLRIVVCGLDMAKFLDDKDLMRDDLGNYPTYLYDSNPFNDVKYIWNRDILWDRAYTMVEAKDDSGFEPGMTSFDDYSSWDDETGIDVIWPDGIPEMWVGNPIYLTDEEKTIVQENIIQNVITLAKEHPEIEFYYFLTPYSAAWWADLVKYGTIYKQIEAEDEVINLMLECENIKLFSFNNMLDITCDLDNYKDERHYGDWINSRMLEMMHEGEGVLTRNNYKEYLDEELHNYLELNYGNLK